MISVTGSKCDAMLRHNLRIMFVSGRAGGAWRRQRGLWLACMTVSCSLPLFCLISQSQAFFLSMTGEGGRRVFIRDCAALAASCFVAGQPQRSLSIGELVETQSQSRFAHSALLKVADIDEAVRFYTDGLGMTILRSSLDRDTGLNSTVLAYGPEQLRAPLDFIPGVSSFAGYGGHFCLEVEGKKGLEASDGNKDAILESDYFDPGNGATLQIAVENYRISSVMKAGGKVLSGYGWLTMEAPGGLRIVLLSGLRRDPVMFVAQKVTDLKRSREWYKSVMGMNECPYPIARLVDDSPFEPRQPKGSVFMAYDGDATGVLLVPAEKKETVRVGSAYRGFVVLADNVEEIGREAGATYVGKTPDGVATVATFTDPDGYPMTLVEYADYDKFTRRK